ncbi:adenylate/guanylate cyclase domain-containing protein [Mycobacterium vicinigordonae]|uniref:Adenylate/guanylate cyclase domain-containing protein n=1 Tax=Mycobacterium vicinigordonae TaxID=1719132 RepID=A0A7D6HY50_9MYCO|nr:adenylate/guanylate cyclase domain-containing protein [Mycobacterium vicinigordonae]QLL10292.1 adenylate/guanylate cyclase domain-containing protein [Mycobacterium vicinigordonae]
MSQMLDFEALEAAGIANPRERADLIKYLADLGFTLDEMAEAEQRGRLFGLAGDVLQWSGRPIYTVAAAAEQLGLPPDEVARAWALLGLTIAGPDVPVLSQADVEGLATWVALKTVVGRDGAFGLLRVLGATMARLAEAESTLIRTGIPDIQMTHTRDELATAQAYRAVAEFVPRIGALIDVVHRHHLTSARTHFEGVIRDTTASVLCGIGFADLSSFTALTQALTPAQLSELLNEFAGAVSDVVHADGGRVVKFIGDEVMWVSASPEQLARAAVDLVNHPAAREEGLQVRAGLAFGTALAINGDYFGTPVNLAARLVSAAAPGEILCDSALRERLPSWPAAPCGPLVLKGFAVPVPVFELSGGRKCLPQR